MSGWIAVLTAILGALVKWLNGRGPSPLQKEAAARGAAEARVQQMEVSNDGVEKANAAAAAARAAVADDDGLRDYVANDPDNRDNDADSDPRP